MIVFFEAWKLHQLINIFSLVACVFGVLSRKWLPNSWSWKCVPMFSSGKYIVLPLTFSSLNMIWINFCTCQIRVQLNIFVCECPVFPAYFVKMICLLRINAGLLHTKKARVFIIVRKSLFPTQRQPLYWALHGLMNKKQTCHFSHGTYSLFWKKGAFIAEYLKNI